ALVQVIVPTATLAWLATGRPAGEAARGAAFGLPLPICSCSVIPLYESLVRARVPATAAMAFLIATPLLGLDAVLISLPLLGGELTLARAVAAALLAFVAGWWIGGRAREDAAPPEPVRAFERGGLLPRLRVGLHVGFGDVVDHTAPWLILGIGAAALVEPMLGDGWLAG